MAGVVLVHNAGRMVTTFLAVYLFTELGLSEHWIGLIVTAYGSGAVLGSLIGGWLTSRIPPTHVILASLTFVALAFFGLSVIADPVLFTLLLFLGALFDGAFRPPVMLLLMDAAAPEDRTRCYALYQTALNIGYAAGAAGGGLLAEIHFPLIFWVDGGSSLAAALLLICLMAGDPTRKADEAPGKDRSGGRRSLNGPLLLLCAVGFLNYCVINQRLSIYPLYLTTDYGLPPSEYGALMMINSLLIAAVGVSVTDRLKRFDQRQIAGAGTLLLCGSFALLPAGNSFEFAFFTCIVVTFGEVLFMPSVVALVYQWSRKESAGRSIGLFFAVHSACRALGPLAGVWSFSLLGTTATWLLCGALGVASALLLLGLLPRHDGGGG